MLYYIIVYYIIVYYIIVYYSIVAERRGAAPAGGRLPEEHGAAVGPELAVPVRVNKCMYIYIYIYVFVIYVYMYLLYTCIYKYINK